MNTHFIDRLKKMVPAPTEPGAYVGDLYFPTGGTDASHRWTGEQWEWMPEFAADEGEPILAQMASLSRFAQVGIMDGMQGNANVAALVNLDQVALALCDLDSGRTHIVFNGGLRFESQCPFPAFAEIAGVEIEEEAAG